MTAVDTWSVGAGGGRREEEVLCLSRPRVDKRNRTGAGARPQLIRDRGLGVLDPRGIRSFKSCRDPGDLNFGPQATANCLFSQLKSFIRFVSSDKDSRL